MNSVVKACGIALAAGLATAPLVGCAGGGGGGGDVVSPPTSPPPTSPPPPPPPPPTASSSGGTIESDAWGGSFRGPLGRVIVKQDDPNTYFHLVQEKQSPGSPDDFVVTVSPASLLLDSPTVTVTIEGEAAVEGATLDFTMSDVLTNASGEVWWVTDTVNGGVAAAPGNSTAQLAGFADIGTSYSALLRFDGRGPDAEYRAFAAIGADVVSMPSTGQATFDSAVYGHFQFEDGIVGHADSDYFYGRGDVVVDFGSGSVSGTFEDVDWFDAPALEETTHAGYDFGLTFNADVLGDDFTGGMQTIDAVGPAPFIMTGIVEGDFYGPNGGSPEEIGAAFALTDTYGFVVGGLLGRVEE